MLQQDELKVRFLNQSRMVDGPLFIVKRTEEPHFQFIVLDQKSLGQMVENIGEGFEYKVQHPYLMYRKASQEIYAMWFNGPDLEAVANAFKSILKPEDLDWETQFPYAEKKWIPNVPISNQFDVLGVEEEETISLPFLEKYLAKISKKKTRRHHRRWKARQNRMKWIPNVPVTNQFQVLQGLDEDFI